MFSGARADALRRLKLKKSDATEYPAEGSSRREHARAVEKVMMKPHG